MVIVLYIKRKNEVFTADLWHSPRLITDLVAKGFNHNLCASGPRSND